MALTFRKESRTVDLFKKPAPRLDPLPPHSGLDDVFSRFTCGGSIIPNAMLIMQRRPKLLRAYVQMVGAVSDPETSEVDVGFKRLIAHVTSRAAGCRYCMAHTAALALDSRILGEPGLPWQSPHRYPGPASSRHARLEHPRQPGEDPHPMEVYPPGGSKEVRLPKEYL